MSPTDKSSGAADTPDPEELAAEAFLRRRARTWSEQDEACDAQSASDPAHADAARRVERAWQAVGDHAASPELMALREQALARARRAGARRWLRRAGNGRWRLGVAAAVAGVVVTLGTVLQLSPFAILPGQYRTGIGEQRVVELHDHSRIALDAKTRLRVRFSQDARVVQLMEGQAQFSVAKDPARAFKVEAGDHTIVAVGTSFTVEYVGHRLRVALLEGKVAILSRGAASSMARAIESQISAKPPRTDFFELTPGEELRSRGGETTIIPHADMEAAIAWRQGKVIFNNEPLGEAVRRLNRYSRLQLVIDDPSLAALQVSGVFEAGDTAAFAEAVQAYLPVAADYSDAGTVRLAPVTSP